MMHRLDMWELAVCHLQPDYQEVLSPGPKAGVLVELAPPGNMDYFSTKMDDDDSYEEINELVLRFVETRSDRGRAPMDVDRQEFAESPAETETQEDEGSHAVRKSGSKWQGQSFSGACKSCGVWGHRASMCLSKGGITCYHCVHLGHRLSQCLVKDVEMKGWPNRVRKKGWDHPKGSAKGFGKNGVQPSENMCEGVAVGKRVGCERRLGGGLMGHMFRSGRGHDPFLSRGGRRALHLERCQPSLRVAALVSSRRGSGSRRTTSDG